MRGSGRRRRRRRRSSGLSVDFDDGGGALEQGSRAGRTADGRAGEWSAGRRGSRGGGRGRSRSRSRSRGGRSVAGGHQGDGAGDSLRGEGHGHEGRGEEDESLGELHCGGVMLILGDCLLE